MLKRFFNMKEKKSKLSQVIWKFYVKYFYFEKKRSQRFLQQYNLPTILVKVFSLEPIDKKKKKKGSKKLGKNLLLSRSFDFSHCFEQFILVNILETSPMFSGNF